MAGTFRAMSRVSGFSNWPVLAVVQLVVLEGDEREHYWIESIESIN
jgi:hypothetical protein